MYIIGNGKLLTLNDAHTVIDNGAVVTDGERIADLGSFDDIRIAYPEAEFIDAAGGIIMPGMIDMHMHSRFVLARGRAIPRYSRMESYRLFRDCLWNIGRSITHDEAAMAVYASSLQCIKTGITTVFEHHSEPRSISGSLHFAAAIKRECGIRACICYDVSERFGAGCISSAIRESTEFYDYCSDLDIGLIKPMFGLDSLVHLSDDTLDACLKANDGRMGFHFHLSETMDDTLLAVRKHRKTPVRYLLDAGVISSNSIAAGCIFTSSDDIGLLVESGCGIAVSPLLSSLIGSAYGENIEALAVRGCIGLGTDSLSSGMIAAARAAVCQFGMSASAIPDIYAPAARMLFKANPAFASRIFGTRLGIIDKGAAADIIIIKPSVLSRLGCSEASIQNLLMDPDAFRCEMTMVAGRVLMREGRLTMLEEEYLPEFLTGLPENWGDEHERYI